MEKKEEEKLQYMREIGKIVFFILEELKKKIKSGISGKDLEKIAIGLMKENKVYSSSLNYNNFPSELCISLNDELTHGIPDQRIFKKGDIVSIDLACYKIFENGKKYHADSAFTVSVEEEDNDLIKTNKDCLDYVIRQIKPGITTIGYLGKMIEDYVRKKNYYTIREYGGHGIGENLHENPFIANYNIKNKQLLEKGMFLCIEPLIQENNNEIDKKIVNNWDIIISKKGDKNSHFEKTIYIGKNTVEILT